MVLLPEVVDPRHHNRIMYVCNKTYQKCLLQLFYKTIVEDILLTLMKTLFKSIFKFKMSTSQITTIIQRDAE